MSVMDTNCNKKKTLRRSRSIDEHPEFVDGHTTVKSECRPDVCPDVQPLHISNIQEPDIVRSSSSSSGNFSRVSSFASTSSSERSYHAQGSKLKSLVCFSQNSLEEEGIPTTSPDAIREKKRLFRERKIDNLSQEGSDDVFEAKLSSPATFHCKEKNRFFSDSSVLSEKGKRKRSEFSSRGYGTGSGGSAQGNSVGKTSSDSSQNSETVVATLAGATDLKTVQLIAIENDFKPKCSQRMLMTTAIPVGPSQPDQNDAKQELNDCAKESLPFGEFSHEDSSHMLGESKGTSCSLLSSVEKTFSTSNRSDLKSVNDGSSALYPLSLRSAQAASSSSGNGSFYINSSDESKLLVSHTAAMPELNDSAKKSLLFGSLIQDVSSHMLGDCKGSSCGPSLAMEKTFSTTSRSDLKDVNDGSRVLFPLSLSSAQAASSSLSNGSFYINSSDENKLQASNADSLLKATCSSSVPGNSVMSSESKYPLEDLLYGNFPYCGTKHQAHPSYLSTSESHFPTSALFVNNELASMLEKSGRCEEEICDDYQCQQVKSRIKELSNGGLKAVALNEEQKSLLYHMCRHVKDCTLPKCPFSWCEPFSIEENLSEEEQLLFMKRELENFTDDKMLHGNMVEFLKMHPKLPYEDLPIEQVHWSRLCMLENSSRAVLAAHNQPEGLEYWVIKKNLVDDDFLWKVCRQLGKLSSNTCVVQMLWAAKFESHVLICSRFEGYHSLQDSLKASAPFGLDLGLIQFLMLQLTSATQHLHGLGIVYLNWTSGNILSYQSDQGIVVKLCNFSAAASLDGYDVGFLKLALPTYILMPELCNEDRVTLASDIWGLGCILYELVTGHPLWHEQRHSSSETLYKMMKDKFSTLASDPNFNLSSVSPKMSPVLSACWEVDPNERLSIIDLQLQLIEAFLSSNPSNPAT